MTTTDDVGGKCDYRGSADIVFPGGGLGAGSYEINCYFCAPQKSRKTETPGDISLNL
jgi:hypothetical protein